ncbi:fructose-1,6-bisphosphatase [Candidatus Micrarchaeota archaeon]|nr:fructose-1,6-bisphosphatase [Candidatus Micrarchaeota archaeon]
MQELFDHIQKDSNEKLAKLLTAIAKTSIDFRIEFPHRLGFSEGENKYGEQQLKLDAWSNQYLVDRLNETGLVKKMYSEELDEPVSGMPNAPYVVCFDPLDGSSNIKSNNTCGTIVSIYENDLGKGSEQVAALYKLYGPVTSLTYTVGQGVHEFVLQQKTGEDHFVLSKENMKLPEPGKVYGIGGKKAEWTPKLRQWVDGLESKGLKLRYSGTLVADFNQVMHYGGLFAYPKAKLRLTYEAKPMALLIEQAGGSSTNGVKSILDVVDEVDARTPLFLGNKNLIAEVEKLNE